MKRYVVVTVLASLWLVASPVSAASQPPKGTIWEYKGDGGKTLWQVCGSQKLTCIREARFTKIVNAYLHISL